MDFSYNHHAYLLCSSRDAGIVAVKDALVATGMRVEGNPDVRVWNEESFSVDTARDVRDVVAKRPFGERQVCIIAGDTFTVEAQNALLKTTEEPGEGTHIVIVTPNPGILLPTLVSRCAPFEVGDAPSVIDTHEADIFLSLSIPERLKYLETIIKNKDKATALALLDGVIVVIRSRTTDGGADAFTASAPLLCELSDMRGYLTDRSSSMKLIMEHVALLLPPNNK